MGDGEFGLKIKSMSESSSGGEMESSRLLAECMNPLAASIKSGADSSSVGEVGSGNKEESAKTNKRTDERNSDGRRNASPLLSSRRSTAASESFHCDFKKKMLLY
jgi:hypothetical protein